MPNNNIKLEFSRLYYHRFTNCAFYPEEILVSIGVNNRLYKSSDTKQLKVGGLLDLIKSRKITTRTPALEVQNIESMKKVHSNSCTINAESKVIRYIIHTQEAGTDPEKVFLNATKRLLNAIPDQIKNYITGSERTQISKRTFNSPEELLDIILESPGSILMDILVLEVILFHINTIYSDKRILLIHKIRNYDTSNTTNGNLCFEVLTWFFDYVETEYGLIL